MNKKNFLYLSSVEVFVLSPDEKKVLLLKRAHNKEVLPDYYAGLGGKMDSDILESPLETALREVEEESGFKKSEFIKTKFRALFTVSDRFGKWAVYEFVFILKTGKKIISDKETEEGTLHWVNVKDLGRLNLIPDLRSGVLEKLLFGKKFLWIKSKYDIKNKLTALRLMEA